MLRQDARSQDEARGGLQRDCPAKSCRKPRLQMRSLSLERPFRAVASGGLTFPAAQQKDQHQGNRERLSNSVAGAAFLSSGQTDEICKELCREAALRQ